MAGPAIWFRYTCISVATIAELLLAVAAKARSGKALSIRLPVECDVLARAVTYYIFAPVYE
jgi:hypothetical protein